MTDVNLFNYQEKRYSLLLQKMNVLVFSVPFSYGISTTQMYSSWISTRDFHESVNTGWQVKISYSCKDM